MPADPDASERLALHFKQMSDIVKEVEEVIDFSADEIDEQSVIKLQRLDFLRQALEDLAHAAPLLAAAGCDCVASVCRSTHISGLKLSTSRALFSVENTQTSAHASGELDLF